MSGPQFYNGQAVFTLTDEPLANSAGGGFDLTKIDLQNTPWKDAEAIQLNAKTVSNQYSGGVSLLLGYAFSTEDITTPDAQPRVGTRAGTLTMVLPDGIDGPTVREFVSARIPIQARYLYLYWNASTTNAEALFDLEVHAIPVA